MADNPRAGDAMQTPKRKTMPRKGAGGRATHDVGGLEFGTSTAASTTWRCGRSAPTPC
jgi:hypothetical protein